MACVCANVTVDDDRDGLVMMRVKWVVTRHCEMVPQWCGLILAGDPSGDGDGDDAAAS